MVVVPVPSPAGTGFGSARRTTAEAFASVPEEGELDAVESESGRPQPMKKSAPTAKQTAAPSVILLTNLCRILVCMIALRNAGCRCAQQLPDLQAADRCLSSLGG